MKDLKLKTIIISIALSLFLLITSSYIALKLGSLPWPIIFSVVAAAGLMRLFGKTDLHEINAASAGGTIGGLTASALVFTIPGIIYLQKQGQNIALPSALSLFTVSLIAGITGIFLSMLMRRFFIDEEKLPYATGAAGAYILKEGKSQSRYARWLVLFGILFFILTALRDIFTQGFITIPGLQDFGISFVILMMPLAIAIGFIIGPKPGFSWFSGSVVGWLLVVPLAFLIFGNDMSAQVQNAGMGIVLGSGLGFFAVFIAPRLKQIMKPLYHNKRLFYLLPATLAAGIICLMLFGVPLIAAILSAASLLLVVPIASRMTGETNIDPLEQFGIFAALLILLIYSLLSLNISTTALFLIVFFVSVTAAIAGDIGQDYKAAKILGTDPMKITKTDMITMLAVAVAVPFVFMMITRSFSADLFTTTMPAPQAVIVAQAIGGLASPNAFLGGMAFAFIFEILNRKKKIPLMLMPFGIGMFLGLSLGFLFFLGGLLALIITRKKQSWQYPGIIIAAAIMAGEGLSGFSLGFFRSLSIPMGYFYIGSAVLIALIIILTTVIWKKRHNTSRTT